VNRIQVMTEEGYACGIAGSHIWQPHIGVVESAAGRRCSTWNRLALQCAAHHHRPRLDDTTSPPPPPATCAPYGNALVAVGLCPALASCCVAYAPTTQHPASLVLLSSKVTVAGGLPPPLHPRVHCVCRGAVPRRLCWFCSLPSPPLPHAVVVSPPSLCLCLPACLS
jgi:hypothetical protein